MNFKRHRRLRKNPLMRDLVRETTLSVNDFIQPLFVKENLEQKEEVASMPGVYQFALADLLEEVRILCTTRDQILYYIWDSSCKG